jgi:hypothetical protein
MMFGTGNEIVLYAKPGDLNRFSNRIFIDPGDFQLESILLGLFLSDVDAE